MGEAETNRPLRSTFVSTPGRVMTDEVGAITGELELQSRLTPDRGAVEALVCYAGAQELYTVSGSPVRGASRCPDLAEHRAAHERILQTLTTPQGVESGNEQPVGLLEG